MRESRCQSLLTSAAILFTLFFCLLPYAYMLLVSLSRHPDFMAEGFAPPLSLENFRAVLGAQSLHFFDYLRNSLIVSGLSAALAVLIAAPAAYAVTRLFLPGKRTVLLAVLALSMFPQVSMVGYLFKLMSRFGWINTYPALVLPYIAWALPLCLWILTSFFAQIPRDLDRAALIDGCTRWQALWRVVLPTAAPGVFSTLLLAFVFAFNEFLFALMLTTDHHGRTIPVGIALFQGLHGELPWGQIMAAAVFTTLPVVALTLLFQRRIIQGLTGGAVKE